MPRLNPGLDDWVLYYAAGMEEVVSSVRAGQQRIDASDTLMTASNAYCHLPYTRTRAIGWEMHGYGLKGDHLYTYMHGYRDLCAVFIGHDDAIIATPAWEGLADGHKDFECLTYLDGLIEKVRDKIEPQALADIKKERERILSSDPNQVEAPAILKWQRKGKASFVIGTAADFRQAKKQLFLLMERLHSYLQGKAKGRTQMWGREQHGQAS